MFANLDLVDDLSRFVFLMFLCLYLADTIATKRRLVASLAETQRQMKELITWNFEGIESLEFRTVGFWKSKYRMLVVVGRFFNPTWYFECIVNQDKELRIAAPVFKEKDYNFGLAEGYGYRATERLSAENLKVRLLGTRRLLTLQDIRFLKSRGLTSDITGTEIVEFYSAQHYAY